MASQTNGNCFPILKGVCVFWKILGLCPFALAEDNIGRLTYGGVSYTTIMVFAYILIYYRAVINRINYVMVRETPMTILADFLGLSMEFILVITVWLYAILRYDRIKRILKMFKKIQETSKTIDISQDIQRLFKTIKVHVFVINFTWLILFTCDHMFLYDAATFKLDIWMPFNFPRIISHNIILMFVDGLWIVKKFFSSLNEKVQNLPKVVAVRLAIPEGNRRSLKIGSFKSFVGLNPLEVYGQLHTDLVTLTKMIVEFFSLSIILLLLVHLVLLASDLYIVCLMIRDRRTLNWKQMATFVELCGWWCLHFLETTALMAISDSTANEANRTGQVLHAMLTIDHTEKYISSAEILSLRLLQSYLNIELYGLIQMRLSVMHKIIGMMGTYTTIMMQIDIQNQQQHQMQRATIELNVSHVS